MNEMIVNYKPLNTKEVIDDFINEKYDRMILSTGEYWFNKEPSTCTTEDIYKVYLIVEKKNMESYLYDEYSIIFNGDRYKVNDDFITGFPSNDSITFTQFKNGEYGTLGYIIGQTLYNNKLPISQKRTIDIALKASFPFQGKATKDTGFYGGNGYLEGGIPKMQQLYINGIRLIQCKYHPYSNNHIKLYLGKFNMPESVLFPQNFYPVYRK